MYLLSIDDGCWELAVAYEDSAECDAGEDLRALLPFCMFHDSRGVLAALEYSAEEGVP